MTDQELHYLMSILGHLRELTAATHDKIKKLQEEQRIQGKQSCAGCHHDDHARQP